MPDYKLIASPERARVVKCFWGLKAAESRGWTRHEEMCNNIFIKAYDSTEVYLAVKIDKERAAGIGRPTNLVVSFVRGIRTHFGIK